MARWIMLWVMALCTAAGARQFYVDTKSLQANDANAGTSLTTPWKTMQKAANTMVAGDTVFVKAGTYSGDVQPANSGTMQNRIYFIRYGTDNVVISGSFNLIKNYITVQGFEVSGGSIMFGFQVAGGSYCQVLGNNMHGGGALFLHGNYNLIRGNIITGMTWDQITTGWGTNATDHCVIEYNEISDPTGAGEDFMQYMGNNMIVRGNYFHHLGDNGRHNDVYQSGGGEYNIWMIGNRFENLGGVQYYMPGSGDHDHIWRGNLFWGSIGWGLNSTNTTGTRVINNTFVVTAGWGVRECGKAYNNIFSPPGSNGHGGSPIDYNCVYPVPCCASQGPHDLWGVDPKYVSSAGHDYRLQSTSPCINAGTFPTATTAAGSGTQIPVGDARIFVDGFGIADGDSIQLQGQTQVARITSINYSTNVLTVNQSLTWTSGQGVSLPYSGSAPDIGAYEYAATTITDFGLRPSTGSGADRFIGALWPNPIKTSALPQYTAGKTGISIYDLQGRTVEIAAIQKKGIYLVRQTGNKATQKIVVIP